MNGARIGRQRSPILAKIIGFGMASARPVRRAICSSDIIASVADLADVWCAVAGE
jgi:hypothetical protein